VREEAKYHCAIGAMRMRMPRSLRPRVTCTCTCADGEGRGRMRGNAAHQMRRADPGRRRRLGALSRLCAGCSLQGAQGQRERAQDDRERECVCEESKKKEREGEGGAAVPAGGAIKQAAVALFWHLPF
jgi:hypothetical protein